MSFKNKIILLSVGALIGIILYVFLFLVPQIENINNLQKNIASFKLQLSNNNTKTVETKSIEENVNFLNAKLDRIQKNYPSNIDFEEMVTILYYVSKKTNFGLTNLNFTPIKELKVDVNKSNQSLKNTNIKQASLLKLSDRLGLNKNIGTTSNSSNKTAIPNGSPYNIGVSFNTKTTLKNLKSFVTELNQLNNKISIDSINLRAVDNSTCEVSMSIRFIGIRDYFAKESTILPDELKIQNKTVESLEFPLRVFDYGANSSKYNNQENKAFSSNDYNRSNFIFTILPFSNGLGPPTTTLEARNIIKTTNIPRDTVIYGNGHGVQNVDFYIEEKDDKFYFKYRTQQEIYPSRDYSKSVEFIPIDNDYRLYINSSKRISKSDTSGINLSIRNTTSKHLTICIANDDKTTPRINIDKNKSTPASTYTINYLD